MDEITTFAGTAIRLSPDERLSQDAEAFILRVGERVRNARARKGISRRVLSELSGVSQRYLAQLEAGEGNISIALLRRVANALDHPVEWLVSEEDPWTSAIVEVSNLYRSANADQRRRVMEILDPEHPNLRRQQRIALIGLRGAGKSTLGPLVGKALNVPFYELNMEIESASGMPVNELIALYGYEGYRKLERQSIERLAATGDSFVLAVAGGIVGEPETFAYLLRNYHTIWLKAQPEDHMTRVRAQGDNRPMAGNPAAMDELRSILTSREALYAKAEAAVNTSGRDIESSVQDVLRTIEANGFLESA